MKISIIQVWFPTTGGSKKAFPKDFFYIFIQEKNDNFQVTEEAQTNRNKGKGEKIGGMCVRARHKEIKSLVCKKSSHIGSR